MGIMIAYIWHSDVMVIKNTQIYSPSVSIEMNIAKTKAEWSQDIAKQMATEINTLKKYQLMTS